MNALTRFRRRIKLLSQVRPILHSGEIVLGGIRKSFWWLRSLPAINFGTCICALTLESLSWNILTTRRE